MAIDKAFREKLRAQGLRSAEEVKTGEELLGALLAALRGLRKAKLDTVQVALLVELLAAGAYVLSLHAPNVKDVPYRTGEADMLRNAQSALITVHGWTVAAVRALDPRLGAFLSAVPGGLAPFLIEGDYDPPLSEAQAVRAADVREE